MLKCLIENKICTLLHPIPQPTALVVALNLDPNQAALVHHFLHDAAVLADHLIKMYN